MNNVLSENNDIYFEQAWEQFIGVKYILFEENHSYMLIYVL